MPWCRSRSSSRTMNARGSARSSRAATSGRAAATSQRGAELVPRRQPPRRGADRRPRGRRSSVGVLRATDRRSRSLTTGTELRPPGCDARARRDLRVERRHARRPARRPAGAEVLAPRGRRRRRSTGRRSSAVSGVDVLVTSGGVSVGPHDLVRRDRGASSGSRRCSGASPSSRVSPSRSGIRGEHARRWLARQSRSRRSSPASSSSVPPSTRFRERRAGADVRGRPTRRRRPARPAPGRTPPGRGDVDARHGVWLAARPGAGVAHDRPSGRRRRARARRAR